jgi:hypothetical protein
MVAKTILVLPNHHHTLKMGTELGPETSHPEAAVTPKKYHGNLYSLGKWKKKGGKTRHEYKERNKGTCPLLLRLDTLHLQLGGEKNTV